MTQLLLFGPPAPEPPFSPPFPCVLHVDHGGGGKMVGKVIEHPQDGFVFYHAHGGSQFHVKHDCPAPIDSCVLAVLLSQQVHWIYSYDRDEMTLYRCVSKQAFEAKIEAYGGRRRHYLPRAGWSAVTPVVERAGAARARLLYVAGQVALVVPYIPASRIWTLEK